MSKNPITGDEIKSKYPTKEYEDGWDRIFNPEQLDLFDEERINIIGQNGNDGLHYEENENQDTPN